MTAATNTRHIISCLIDDDFIHQFGMKRMIQKYLPLVGVIEFSNGLDAINYLKMPHEYDEIPELIFLDINMPVMNGWEFMEEFVKIRSAIQKKIEIYILSSSTDSHDIQRAKSNPEITGYIVKPLNAESLQNIFLYHQKQEQIH